jgi:hypothetical protein
MATGDTKLVYGSSAAYTLTLESLAHDANLLAGRESTAVDNTTNKYLDYLIGGKIKLGTGPTAGGVVEAWVYASEEDTPTYPDVFDGTDSNESVTSANVKYAGLALLGTAVADATTGEVLWFKPRSLAQLFGGAVPKYHGIFIVHSTGVALDASAAGTFWYTPVYANVAAS